MSFKRKFYYLGFAIYLFSFFLPAILMFNEPVMGYEGALWLFGSLFKFKGLIDYLFTVFVNLSNIFTIMVFALQFKLPAKKLIIYQLIAFLSAFFWAGLGLVEDQNLNDFFIGYWNWLFGIFIMLIAMFASIKEQKKLMGSPQRRASL